LTFLNSHARSTPYTQAACLEHGALGRASRGGSIDGFTVAAVQCKRDARRYAIATPELEAARTPALIWAWSLFQDAWPQIRAVAKDAATQHLGSVGLMRSSQPGSNATLSFFSVDALQRLKENNAVERLTGLTAKEVGPINRIINRQPAP